MSRLNGLQVRVYAYSAGHLKGIAHSLLKGASEVKKAAN